MKGPHGWLSLVMLVLAALAGTAQGAAQGSEVAPAGVAEDVGGGRPGSALRLTDSMHNAAVPFRRDGVEPSLPITQRWSDSSMAALSVEIMGESPP